MTPGGEGAQELVRAAIAAAGGRDRWEGTDRLSLRVRSGGLAFASKFAPRMRGEPAHLATTGQRTEFEGFPLPEGRGVFDSGSVWIETPEGEPVERRDEARAAFRSGRRLLWWDRLDMLYFSGYALWTYGSLPFVLERPGYEVRELEPWSEGGETWRRLHVRFPKGVHTHSRDQVLHFDERGLLRRHDYTAEPFGGWARAAHYPLDYRTIDGFAVASRRRVYPRLPGGRRAPGPLLVRLEVAPA